MSPMSSINALLNHEGAHPPTTTFEAADALTTLATLGRQQFAPDPARELPSPTAFSAAPRSSSFDSAPDARAPVEPSPPRDPPAPPSPSLAHYHHAAHSPAEQHRRRSLLTDPAPVLAPILRDDHTVKAEAEPSHAPAETTTETTDTADAANTADTSRPDTPGDTPRPDSPGRDSPRPGSPDQDTLRAIEAAKASDLGLRAKRTASVAESLTSPGPSRKRPAPALKKKGTAKTKPSKKRKIDDDAARSVTPTATPTAHPRPKKTSHAGTPLQSSPAPDDDDASSSEDHNLYCICKKPDNHKWMIGCDGGCDDWFHGDCVNMKQADEHLVDKFICPLCEDRGKGHTTWKPMCRRDACRRPARPAKDHESKYCSDDCGVLFMRDQLQRTAGAKSRKKKKPARPDARSSDDEPTPLGGTLRAKDLKALVDASPNIQAFRSLGSGVLSPPHTASPTRPDFPDALTAAETDRLTALHNEKSQLQARLQLLKDREKFVSMAKERAARLADREKIKPKDFCGYDPRLAWSDAEFSTWRAGPGREAFDADTLNPGPDADDTCLRKRCAKHPQWQKLNLQDARFEELEVVEAIRECEKEEGSVRDRARRRAQRESMKRELTAGEGRGSEGWVEGVRV